MEGCVQQALRSKWIEQAPPGIELPGWVNIIGHQFVVPKPNGAPRLIYDGRPLNYFLESHPYVLPTVQLPLTDGCRWMGKVDISHAFLHFEVSDQLKRLQGFRHNGKVYRWTKLIWGTSAAPYIM
jgi:hypothetical protein